eukprot:scaffold36779_cov155-Skeletonema_dohrnii-CCMP3373.AAC.1
MDTKQSSQLNQEEEQTMQSVPRCSSSNDDRCSQRCSQHQVGNISDTASSDSNPLTCQASTTRDTVTHTRTEVSAHGYMLASANVHSTDHQASLPLMRGDGDDNTEKEKPMGEELKHEMKYRSNEKRREMGVVTSDCATETSVGSSSTSLTRSKSKSRKVADKSTGSHLHRTSESSPTNYSASSSSTDLLYRALHNDRSINDSSSSSSADAETNKLTSSQRDVETETDLGSSSPADAKAETDRSISSQKDKATQSKSQNLTQIRRKRKRHVHPTAQDQSVSSLNSNSSSSSAVLAHALYDSSSSSTDSGPRPE